jgi:hypothetical protein
VGGWVETGDGIELDGEARPPVGAAGIKGGGGGHQGRRRQKQPKGRAGGGYAGRSEGRAAGGHGGRGEGAAVGTRGDGGASRHYSGSRACIGEKEAGGRPMDAASLGSMPGLLRVGERRGPVENTGGHFGMRPAERGSRVQLFSEHAWAILGTACGRSHASAAA